MPRGKVSAISGIDTDIGKSVVTGLMGKYLLDMGQRVITQKICQTGCATISEDIKTHRKIMGIELCDADRNGLTCPYVFTEPCSPHLAAKIEGQVIVPDKIRSATLELQEQYDIVLLEGVGGLMVPLNDEHLLIDYLSAGEYENVLVSCPRLGSVNHTLLSLELLHNRSMPIRGIVYNTYFQASAVITEDSKEVFKSFLESRGYSPNVIEIGRISSSEQQNKQDFDKFFEEIFD